MLKLGFPPEAAFLSYFFMTIFVQLGCLLVLRTIVDISLREYVFKMIVPLIVVSLFGLPLPFIVSHIMDIGFLRLCCVTLVSIVTSSLSFYFIGLDTKEKYIVQEVINKITRYFR
mgnify:FL=1